MKKEKVCLVFPPHQRTDAYYVTPPLGLLSIGAVLEKENINVVIHDQIFQLRNGELSIDISIYDACAKKILSCNPTIVGFYTQCITYPSCLNIAKRIKSINPDIKIMFGGHNSAFLDIETLQEFPSVDYIVRGEGEITVPNLIKAIQQNKDLKYIRGITYRDEEGRIIKNEDEPLIEDLDTLPLPAYHLVNEMSEYKRLGETMTILLESGRGCIYSCIFCSNCQLWKRKVRFKSIPCVIDEIKSLERYKPDEYYLIHDFFTFDENYVLEFCKALKENNLNIKWNCRCRLNVNINTLAAMKEAGCQRLLYGVESGSEKILKIMHKNVKFAEVFDSIRNTIKCGIIPSLSFVVGLPEETLEDLDKTLTLILHSQLIGNCYPFMQIISPLPGTAVIKNYSKELYLKTATAFSKGIEYNEGGRLKEDQDLIEKYPLLFSSFYNIRTSVDINYLEEIARIFCIIQEVYGYIYYFIIEKNGIKAIDLYDEWRNWLIQYKKICSDEINNLTKREIWKLFDDFIVSNKLAENDILLKNLYQYVHANYVLIIHESTEYSNTVEFDINITDFIQSLKNNLIPSNIETQKCKIMFTKKGDIIKIYKIKRNS